MSTEDEQDFPTQPTEDVQPETPKDSIQPVKDTNQVEGQPQQSEQSAVMDTPISQPLYQLPDNQLQLPSMPLLFAPPYPPLVPIVPLAPIEPEELSATDYESRTVVSVSGYGWYEAPKNLFKFVNARQLIVDANRLPTLGAQFACFTRVELVSARHNHLGDVLGANFVAWSRLHTLDLSHNDLHALPAEVAHCTQLRLVNLNANAFTEVPEGLYKLANLQVLNMNDNQLTGTHLIIYS